MNNKGLNYGGLSFKKLIYKIDKSKSAIEKILYPEKKPEPLPELIVNRTKIVTEIKNNIDKIYFNNADYFSKLNELNSNKKKKKNINKRKKNFMKKNVYTPSPIEFIQKFANSNYIYDDRNRRLTKTQNLEHLFRKKDIDKTDISINFKTNSLSSRNEKNKIFKKKINRPMIYNKENNKNNSNSELFNSSETTKNNISKTTFGNKKFMKKAISSVVLNEKLDSFNNFKKNEDLNIFSYSQLKNGKSEKNILSNFKPFEKNLILAGNIPSNTKRENIKQISRCKTSRENKENLTNIFLNSNSDINKLNSPKINIYNNYNNMFSEGNDNGIPKENCLKNEIVNFSASYIKVKTEGTYKNKFSKLNNLKKTSINFKNYFNNKVKSLNNLIRSRNKSLIVIIETNNEIKSSRNHQKKSKLEDELDIRKDLLDKNKKIIIDEKIEKNLNLKNKEQINRYNNLKKNINRYSDLLALDIIEKCIDKKQREKLDVNKLFEDHNNKKIEKEIIHNFESRKKAEKNYKRMIKMKYNYNF